MPSYWDMLAAYPPQDPGTVPMWPQPPQPLTPYEAAMAAGGRPSVLSRLAEAIATPMAGVAKHAANDFYERYPTQAPYFPTSQSTDYDPRRAAASGAAEQGLNFLGVGGPLAMVRGGASLGAAGGKMVQPPGLDRTLRRPTEAQLEAKPIVGAPIGVTNARQERALRERYMKQMEEGAGGRGFYDESGNAIYSRTGDSPDMASRFGEGIAVTSASTSVPANATFAIKGHNQAVTGSPVRTGRYPEAMSPQVDAIYRAQDIATGQKRAPFADQLAHGGGYLTKPEAQHHRAVHDIWDGEAWGYINPDGTPLRQAFSPTQHRWMDKQMNKVLAKANTEGLGGFSDWTPGRAQASSWAGARQRAGQASPADARLSYDDYFKRADAQGSRETVPGKTTGHGPELLNAPYGVRQLYDDEVAKILYDQKGRDRIAMGTNSLVGGHIKGPGVFEGGINPGRQTLTATGSDAVALSGYGGNQVPIGSMVGGVKAPETRAIDPASFALMSANEARFGQLMGQDAAAFGRTFDAPVALRNATEFALPATLTNAQAERVMKMPGWSPQDMALIPTPQGARMVNFNDQNILGFNDLTKRVGKEFGSKPVGRSFSGGLMGNRWDLPEGRYGQQYMPDAAPPALPKLSESFDATMPALHGKIRQLDDQFFKEYGLTISPHIQDMRAAIASDGQAGIAKLVQRLGLGVAAIAPLTAFARDQGWLTAPAATGATGPA